MKNLPIAQIIATKEAIEFCPIDTILNAWNNICEPEKQIYKNGYENIDKVFDKPSDLYHAFNREQYFFDDMYITKSANKMHRYSFSYLFFGDYTPYNGNELAKYLIENGDSDCPIDRELLKMDLVEWISNTYIDRTEVEKGIHYLKNNDMKFDPLMENWNDLKEEIL